VQAKGCREGRVCFFCQGDRSPAGTASTKAPAALSLWRLLGLKWNVQHFHVSLISGPECRARIYLWQGSIGSSPAGPVRRGVQGRAVYKIMIEMGLSQDGLTVQPEPEQCSTIGT
jgi:hypothetical protein